MRIASWNVNSLKVRLPHVEQWCRDAQPDVLALQETKTEDGKFPCEAVETLGYRCVFSGQKTYNGVALLSREPIEDILGVLRVHRAAIADDSREQLARVASARE